MTKKSRIKTMSAVLHVVLLLGCCLYQKVRHDNPAVFAVLPVSTKGVDDCNGGWHAEKPTGEGWKMTPTLRGKPMVSFRLIHNTAREVDHEKDTDYFCINVFAV